MYARDFYNLHTYFPSKHDEKKFLLKIFEAISYTLVKISIFGDFSQYHLVPTISNHPEHLYAQIAELDWRLQKLLPKFVKNITIWECII